jgi:hypothetical protein
MRFRPSVPKAAWSFLYVSAAILAGCETPPDPTSAEAQKGREERNAIIAKQEELANKNSKGVVLKSIKGNMKVAPQPAK